MLLALLNAGLASGQKTPRTIADWVKEHAAELLAALAHPTTLTECDTLGRALIMSMKAPSKRRLPAIIRRWMPTMPPPAGCGLRTAPGSRAIGGWQGTAGRQCSRRTPLPGEPGAPRQRVPRPRRCPGKGHEIQAVQRLLADRDLSSTVTTMDALLTQRSVAELIIRQHGHYLMVVKSNQPELYNVIALLFESPPLPVVPGEVLDYTCPGKEHGRLETRNLACSPALATYAYRKWPGLAQVMRRTCQRIHLRTGQVERQTRYGLTSLDVHWLAHGSSSTSGANTGRSRVPVIMWVTKPRAKIAAKYTAAVHPASWRPCATA